MHIIVTGGSGFIGSRLVARALSLGHEVSVIDLVPSLVEGVTMHTASVLDAEAMRRTIVDAGAVIHLAGYVRDGVRRDPYAGATLQLQGTLNVLEACRVNKVPQFVLASSFYVYSGLSAVETVDEDTHLDTLNIELFGAGKLMSEILCREYTKKYGLTHTILRLGSAYGAGGSNVIRTFFETAMRGQVLEIWGSGRRGNQYTYVGDLVEGIIASLSTRNQTFNLISPEVTTTAALADIVYSHFGTPIRFDRTRSDDAGFPFMSPAKAIAELSWHPVTLKEGLEQTLCELRERGLGQTIASVH